MDIYLCMCMSYVHVIEMYLYMQVLVWKIMCVFLAMSSVNICRKCPKKWIFFHEDSPLPSLITGGYSRFSLQSWSSQGSCFR